MCSLAIECVLLQCASIVRVSAHTHSLAHMHAYTEFVDGENATFLIAVAWCAVSEREREREREISTSPEREREREREREIDL